VIKIKIIKKSVMQWDDEGRLAEGIVSEPETPLFPLSVHYPNAVKVEIGNEFYTVYEPGDVIPSKGD